MAPDRAAPGGRRRIRSEQLRRLPGLAPRRARGREGGRGPLRLRDPQDGGFALGQGQGRSHPAPRRHGEPARQVPLRQARGRSEDRAPGLDPQDDPREEGLRSPREERLQIHGRRCPGGRGPGQGRLLAGGPGRARLVPEGARGGAGRRVQGRLPARLPLGVEGQGLRRRVQDARIRSRSSVSTSPPTRSPSPSRRRIRRSSSPWEERAMPGTPRPPSRPRSSLSKGRSSRTSAARPTRCGRRRSPTSTPGTPSAFP